MTCLCIPRSQVRILSPRLGFGESGKTRSRKIHASDLASIVKKLDSAYRSGNALVSDQQFDHLLTNLRRVDPDNAIFKGSQLLRLANGNYKKWLQDTILPDTRLIIEPKIDGCAIALSYEKGALKKAISRKGTDKTETLRTIQNIPSTLPIDQDIQIRGELYGPGLEPARSQRLAAGHLRKKVPTGEGLAFCAFQILNSDLNHSIQLLELEKLGFEIPESEFTKFSTSEVELYRKLWLQGKLFNNYPTDGIVIKVNSRKLQKQLGESSVAPNWAYAVKH